MACRVSPETELSLSWQGSLTWRFDPYVGSFLSASVDDAYCFITGGHGGIEVVAQGHNCPPAIEGMVPAGADWTTWAINIGPMLGTEPGPGPVQLWFVAWVPWIEEEPGGPGHWGPVTTPFGEMSTCTIEFEIALRNLELYKSRSAPYAPSGQGARGARQPRDFHSAYHWVIGADSERYTFASCPYLFDYEGNNVTEAVYSTGWPEEYWGEEILPGTTSVFGSIHDGETGYTYIQTELSCHQHPILWDGWDVRVPEGESGPQGQIRAWGEGNICRWDVVRGFDRVFEPSYQAWAVVYGWWCIEQLHLAVRDGEGGRERLDALVDIFGVTQSVEQWRESVPIVIEHTSWAGYRSNLPAPVTTSVFAPEINEAWAEENDYHPDARVIITDDWGLDGAPNEASPYRLLALVQRMGIQEPLWPAEVQAQGTPEELGWHWGTSGGVSAQWVAESSLFADYGNGWLFQVTAEGTATMALTTNYDDRIEACINESTPEWALPGWRRPWIPEDYRQLAANRWDPEHERPEQITDWAEAPWLCMLVGHRGGNRPADLRVRIGYKLPQIVDNRCTGLTRRDGDADHEPHSIDMGPMHYVEYTLIPRADDADGYHWIWLPCPQGASAGPGVMPDLRWVREIVLIFPAPAGDDAEYWWIYPYLTPPPVENWQTATGPLGALVQSHRLALHRCDVEGINPMDGPKLWGSIFVDGWPACQTVNPYNLRMECGLIFYEAQFGAASGYDFGIWLSLEQLLSYIIKHEGFAVQRDEAAQRAMEYEDGDPQQGRLWEVMCTDVKLERLAYGENELALWCAHRVRSVQWPAALPCRVWSPHHVSGGAVGVAQATDKAWPQVEQSALNVRAYERPPEGGMWRPLGPGQMTEAPPLWVAPFTRRPLWETAVRRGRGRIIAAGAVPHDELWFVRFLVLGPPDEERIGGALWVYTDHLGVAWAAWLDDDDVVVARMKRQLDILEGANIWSERTVIATMPGAIGIGITGDGRALRVVVNVEGALYELWSLDRGRSWSQPREVA